ncbi:uncharacterized protein LOC142344786 isoform X3 [Convolutriloba macropyga]|uniref:uncharacterized protein LOC142344786 isoform X3 n=1 Tax=Convolutriloba macropyga TaxID=536237 RepID=UPI003F523791
MSSEDNEQVPEDQQSSSHSEVAEKIRKSRNENTSNNDDKKLRSQESSNNWEGFSPHNSIQQNSESKSSPVVFIATEKASGKKSGKKHSNSGNANLSYGKVNGRDNERRGSNSNDTLKNFVGGRKISKSGDYPIGGYNSYDFSTVSAARGGDDVLSVANGRITSSLGIPTSVPNETQSVDLSAGLYSPGAATGSSSNSLQGSSRGSVSSSKTNSPKKTHYYGGMGKMGGHYSGHNQGNRSGYRDDGRNFYGGKSSVNYHNQHKKDINSPNKPGNSSASGYGVRKPFNGKYKGGNRSGNFGGIGAYGHRNNDYSSMVHHQNRHRKSPATFNQSRDNYQGYGAVQRNEVSNNVTPTSQANNVPKNAILALLNGGAAADGVTAAETSNISPVPPLQTLQTTAVVTSHEDVPISQVADQSSTTTYISPNVAHSLNPVPTSSSAPDVSAASDRREQGSSNQGTSNGSSGGHSVSVVASQSSFQATAPPVTAAIPDVSSESAPLFAGNQIAVPTLRDVNNNPNAIQNGRKNRPENISDRITPNTPNTSAGLFSQNTSNFSSTKRKNRNQQGNNKNNGTFSDRLSEPQGRIYNGSNGPRGPYGLKNTNLIVSQGSSSQPGTSSQKFLPFQPNSLHAAKDLMGGMFNHHLLGTYSAANAVSKDLRFMSELVNNYSMPTISSLPMSLSLMRAFNETLGLQATSAAALSLVQPNDANAVVSAVRNTNSPLISSAGISTGAGNNMIASGGGGGGGVDQITRPNSASPVISVSAATQSVSNQMINGPTLSAQAASLIGPNLIAPNNTPTPPTVISSSGSTNMAAAQMSQMGLLNMFTTANALGSGSGPASPVISMQPQSHSPNDQLFPNFGQLFRNNTLQLVNSQLYQQHLNNTNISEATNLFPFLPVNKMYQNLSSVLNNSRVPQTWPASLVSAAVHSTATPTPPSNNPYYPSQSTPEGHLGGNVAASLGINAGASQGDATAAFGSHKNQPVYVNIPHERQPPYTVVPYGSSTYANGKIVTMHSPMQERPVSEKQGEIKSKSANSFIEFDQNRMAEFGTVNAEAKQRPLVTSEEQLAKRRLKKDGQMQPTIPLQRKTFSSQFQHQPSKQGAFCIVTPDEVGRSAYHCTDLCHQIVIEIWNPTTVGVEITPKISSWYEIGAQFALPPMKPGTSSFTEIMLQNRSRVSTRLWVCICNLQGLSPQMSVVKIKGVSLGRKFNQVSFDTHGYVDLGPNGINYDQIILTVKTTVPLSCRDVKAKPKICVYAMTPTPQYSYKLLSNIEFQITVDQPKLYIPPYCQQLELHEGVKTCSIPVRNCVQKHLSVTVRCNNPAFAVNPVEMDILPFTTLPVTITYDQSDQREQASVVITVEPEGPVYTVNVDGRPRARSIQQVPLPSALNEDVVNGRGSLPLGADGDSQLALQQTQKGCEEAPVVSEEVGTRHNSKTGTESTEKSSDSIRFKGQPQARRALVPPGGMLRGKVILSNVEYLLFIPNGIAATVKRLCVLKNNSSYNALVRLSFQDRRPFSINALYRGHDNTEVDSKSDTVELLPQEELKVVVQFQEQPRSQQKAQEICRSHLIIRSYFKDKEEPVVTNVHNTTSTITTNSFGDTNAKFLAAQYSDVAASAPISHQNNLQLTGYAQAVQDYTPGIPVGMDAPNAPQFNCNVGLCDDDDDELNTVRLPLIAYSGSSNINVTVKRMANVDNCWNLAATIVVQNMGDRFAYVCVTSQHVKDCTPQCFSINPRHEVQITKLYLRPGPNGNIVEITWGDALIKQLFDKFCNNKCAQASKQAHSFLVSQYLPADSQNQSYHLPLKEEMPNLDVADLVENIYTTEITIGPECTESTLKGIKSTVNPLTEKLFMPNVEQQLTPNTVPKPTTTPAVVSFDKPSEADFPLLVSTPPEPTKVAIGIARQIKPKSDPVNYVITPKEILTELSNTSYNYKLSGFCKIYGSFTVTNNHNLQLECEITCSDETIMIKPNVFLVESKGNHSVIVESFIKSDELPVLNRYGDNSSLQLQKWAEICAKLRFDDRKDAKIRSPNVEKLNLYLPGSLYDQKLASKLIKANDVHCLMETDEPIGSGPTWQITFGDARFGDCSETLIKFKNCYCEKVKWTLSSLFHCFLTVSNPFLVGNSSAKGLPVLSPSKNTNADLGTQRLGLYRVRFPVFRLEKTSGFLEVGETAVVRCEFWPIEMGKFIQHFELAVDSRLKGDAVARAHRLFLRGFGLSRGKALKEASPKKRLERIDLISDMSKEMRDKFVVTIDDATERLTYEPTLVGSCNKKHVLIKNADSKKQHHVKFLNPEQPFVVNHEGLVYPIGARRILKVPITFKPTDPGFYSCFFLVITDSHQKSVIPIVLLGNAVEQPKQLRYAIEPLGLSCEQIIAASPRSDREENSSSKSEESVMSLESGIGNPAIVSARRVSSGSKRSNTSSNSGSHTTTNVSESEITEMVSECASASVVDSRSFRIASEKPTSSSSEESIVLISPADIKNT